MELKPSVPTKHNAEVMGYQLEEQSRSTLTVNAYCYTVLYGSALIDAKN